MPNWFGRLAATLVLIAAVFPPGAEPTRAAEAQDDAAIGLQFLGIWRLVSWTAKAADGSTRPGLTDVGYLVYTDVNRMCAVMMDSKRPRWPAGRPSSVEDAIARYAGFVSYCAVVEVHASEGFVLHHVDVERSPNIVGTTRKRWYSFQGPNRITLRIDPAELTGGVTESTLVWERVQK